MKVLIQKPDLDTCLAALILGVTGEDEIVVAPEGASKSEIDDPSVLCIEAGGSGLVSLNNFDHHDPERYFPPACRQAYEFNAIADDSMKCLVDYVSLVDDHVQEGPAIAFPSLSSIFSGMRLVEPLPFRQFFMGMDLLRRVLKDGLDPFAAMPDLPEWRNYRQAKEDNMRSLSESFQNVVFFQSESGRKVGFSESSSIGGIGGLYKQGCDVAILFNDAFGNPPVRKFTVAGNGVRVSHLLPFIDKLESGWGGRETIIGSPARGSLLSYDAVIDIVIHGV